MFTELLVVLLIATALAACGLLSWKLYELNEAVGLTRVHYEDQLNQLRRANEVCEGKLSLLKEVFEKPSGIASLAGAQQELANAIKNHAPHLYIRHPHALAVLQGNENFFLSIYKVAPELLSESAGAMLEKHKPIVDVFFDSDASDPIAEAGVILLRAKNILERGVEDAAADSGAKHMLSTIAQSLQIGVKRSPKLAEIVEAWSEELDAEG